MGDDEPEVTKKEKEVEERQIKKISFEEKTNNTEQDKSIREYLATSAERVSIKSKLEAIKVKIAETEKKNLQKRQNEKGKGVTR